MTRIDEVDDVEHERSEEQRNQKEGNSLGAGTQGANVIFVNPASKRELTTS